MKPLFYTKTIIALAVAVAAAACAASQAQEQPIPPPAAESALPADFVPGTPLAEVVKMVQAGVEASTIRSYILNSQSSFNVDADKIMVLKDLGVPSDLVNAMIERDKTLYAASLVPPPAPAAAPAPVQANNVVDAPPIEPPAAPVTVDYFYNSLAPYGSWVTIEGYGRCWRPTTVVYDASWRPYGDRGHWVYTDCGWYWDSDYAWGSTFHYGRWFNSPHFGWCWYPGTVWAPSWVTWRSGGDYCGWAPLPPFAVFTPGIGFYYHGVSVGLNFDFGLNASCFLFVSSAHFCDHHPRSYCVPQAQVTQVYHQTTVINNYNVHNQTIVNQGIPVNHISSVTHHPIEPVHVSSLPNAGRQGWRGEGYEHTIQHASTDHNAVRNLPSSNNQLHQENLGQTSQASRQNGNQIAPAHSSSLQNLGGQANNNPSAAAIQRHNELAPVGNNQYQPSQRSYTPSAGPATEHRTMTYNSQPGGIEHGQTQSSLQQQQAFQARQTRASDATALNGGQQHGATQLQQYNFASQSQPRGEPVTHSYTPPVASAPTHSEPHNANSGSTSSSGRAPDQGKPNH